MKKGIYIQLLISISFFIVELMSYFDAVNVSVGLYIWSIKGIRLRAKLKCTTTKVRYGNTTQITLETASI